jgi:NitT/TauT family transport system permease protein
MRRLIRRPSGIGAEMISPIVVLALWELLAETNVLNTRFWPAPSTIASSLWQALAHGGLGHDIWLTTERLVIGLAIGGVLGLAAGLGMGLSRTFRSALRPLIAMTYPIPKIAILPLFLVLFGISERAKWAIVAVGVFYVVAINTFAGINAIDPVFNETATVYRVSWMRRIRTVALPGALPLILTGFELGIGVGFLLIVAAEFVSAQAGLGYNIWLAWQTFDIPLMYASLAVIAVYGLFIQILVRWLHRRLVPWQQTA